MASPLDRTNLGSGETAFRQSVEQTNAAYRVFWGLIFGIFHRKDRWFNRSSLEKISQPIEDIVAYVFDIYNVIVNYSLFPLHFVKSQRFQA